MSNSNFYILNLKHVILTVEGLKHACTVISTDSSTRYRDQNSQTTKCLINKSFSPIWVLLRIYIKQKIGRITFRLIVN